MDRILIVDDEPDIRELIRLHLERAGWDIAEAGSGRQAILQLQAQPFSLIVLDIMMDDGNGFEVLRYLREHRPETLVIALSARREVEDRIDALGLGADDYMTKPFSMRELIARCKALLRRVERAKVIAKNSENEKLLDFGSMVIDPAQRIVTVNGEQVHLTPTEFDLLATLAHRPKSVLTREKLLEEVWDWVDASGTRTVDSHVKALRHKLGADTIRTVHGVGYAFEPPTA